MGERVVTLYRAPGCHLCESAQRVLAAVREEIPFQLVEVDIDGDPKLESAYRERIPVVALDGTELYDFFVDEVELRARLDARVRRA